jgi:hypothetical protein
MYCFDSTLHSSLKIIMHSKTSGMLQINFYLSTFWGSSIISLTAIAYAASKMA